jgi:glutathione S-transferase
MASYKLHTNPGNFRAFKILIAAEYNKIDIEVVTPSETSSFSKLPALETPNGDIITESNAIARFVAKLRGFLALKSFFYLFCV